MSEDSQPVQAPDADDDVEAQVLKETLGAGLAAAAIFAGSSQAAPYPVPSPPGTADATAELSLIPDRSAATRAVQQAEPKAKKAKKVKKKAVKGKQTAAPGSRARQPQ